MTTQRDQAQNNAAKAETTGLVVSAKVIVTDASGTEVSTPDMGKALRTIRSRFHDDTPLIVLDKKHRRDRLFASNTAGWLLTETETIPVEGTELPRNPDYTLTYTDFTLSDPQVPGSSKPCSEEAILPVAMKTADASGTQITLKSVLVGFASELMIQPGDAQTQQDAQTETVSSVLDLVSPETFTDQTYRTPEVLVHPQPPLRSGNLITIPEATGVRYNAPAGQYPIAGDGVSVSAEPEPGYVFPVGVTTEWDFEYQDQGEPAVEEPSAASYFQELIDEQETLLDTPDDLWPLEPDETATDALASPAPPRRARRKEQSSSKELVLRQSRPIMWLSQPRVWIPAAVLVLVLALAAILLFGRDGSAGSETAADPAAGESLSDWVTTVESPVPTNESITEDHTVTTWDLPAEHAEQLSWYSAGVAHIDSDDALVLLSTLSGEEIARIDLEAPVEWTAEFIAGDHPAVGARTEESFHAITDDGVTQSWDIDEDSSLRVMGTTPMLTTDAGNIYALIVGEDEPVEVSANPDYQPAAIDDQMLIQVAAGMPRVVTLPVTDDDNLEATEMRLSPPVEGASFSRHLTVGHQLSLSEWYVDDEAYLVVHDLSDDGSVTAAVPSVDDAGAWSIGRGMDLAIIGPYAFDLETGDLVAEIEDQPFVSALGPVPVIQSNDGREFIIDGELFYESTRVIGYTGGGTILVRNPDGSVAALDASAGTV